MRAVRLQCASGHERLILRIVFLLDGNCVTLRAFACRSGASAVCVCVCVCARLWKCDCVRACAGGCMRICARVRVRAQPKLALVCVRGGRRGEPELSYLKLFLLSDCLASELSLRPSSVFASISSALPSFPPPAWMDDGL